MPSLSKKPPAFRPLQSTTYTLDIVSDATGGLARHMITAVLTQFRDLKINQVFHIFKRGPDDVRKTINSFKKGNHLVLYALLNPESKHALGEACTEMNIPHFDLTGSLVQFIMDHTGAKPVNELALLHQTNEGYFQRIDAMEFTAQHDDGLGLSSLDKADMVIVGLSRVSKSPTSTYLSSLGYKVANISITPETGYPAELDAVADKVVAFTLQPRRLYQIRCKRFEDTAREIEEKHLQDLPYYNLRHIIREVMDSEAEYKRRGYPIINITDMTVEETAARILRLYGAFHASLSYQ
jgi:[pyruvate, water dikinase]-phosphate phosphotransferase / [pyruvate, water dikinase] kinase